MRNRSGLTVAVIVLWALGYPLGALGVSAMSPMLLLFLRFGLSAVVMCGFVAASGRRLPRGRALAHAAVAGLLTQACQFVGLYLGLYAGVPASVAALVIAVNPAATTIAARIALGEELTRRRVVAATVGLAAVVAACWSAVPHLAHVGAGIGFTLLGLVGLVAGGLYQQRFCKATDPVTGNAIGLVVATPVTCALTVLLGAHVYNVPRALVVVTAMVLLSSLVATTLYVRLVATSGAAGAAAVFAVIPAVTALFAFFLLGDRPTAGTWVGLALGAISCLVAAGGHRGERRAGTMRSARSASVRSDA
ncbi:DMT family transporter [Tsukamurella sp. 8F]|uniref:DMT family transporter n=1 Tax=unclassified Tsukamurella TaxID=2633480 RepID=UPI0023B9DCFF|nr:MULTISPECIES: DMT family transporter [unclassified Tsukamurella]MDF0532633.1 DMT family transporter [Tsukamurella sp. 8J]MDF0585160.1 DMT family transporter [Tsukamurella sp. 8F]